MRNFDQVFRFLAMPVALLGFVLVATQVAGIVLRKEQRAKMDKMDSYLVTPAKNPPG
jgi:hypothetical protein